MLFSNLPLLFLSLLLNLSPAQSAHTSSTSSNAGKIPMTNSPNSTTTTSSSAPPPTPYSYFHTVEVINFIPDSTAQKLYIEDIEAYTDSAGFVTSRTIAGHTYGLAPGADYPTVSVLYADEPLVCGATAMSTITAGQSFPIGDCRPVSTSTAKGDGQRMGDGVVTAAAAAAAAAAAMGVGLL